MCIRDRFKSDLVIELLKGEKDLNSLATENNIQPNLLRNWKKEFLNNASSVFDDKREENLKDKLAEERKEKAEYAKDVYKGQGLRFVILIPTPANIPHIWSTGLPGQSTG